MQIKRYVIAIDFGTTTAAIAIRYIFMDDSNKIDVMSLSCPADEVNGGLEDPVYNIKAKTSSDIHFMLKNPGEVFSVDNSFVGTAPSAC
jgi:hypothetical protein